MFYASGACGNPLSSLFEGHFPRSTRVHVLVFDLNADHRATLLEEKALHLFCYLGKIAPDIKQVSFVIGTYRNSASIQPVWQSSVTTLTVSEGTDPEQHL